MRPLFLALGVCVLSSLVSLPVLAQNLYRIGQPSMGGSGCPARSVSATVSPDGSAISILFDKFYLDVPPGSYNPAGLMRMCHFHIPVEIQPGYNLEATFVDYRGFAQIPQGVMAQVITSGPLLKFGRFMGGTNNNMITNNLEPMVNGFFVRQEIQQGFRGQCQVQRHLNFSTQIKIGGPYRLIRIPSQTQVVIDSTDLAGSGDLGIELGMRIVPCR